MGCWHDYLPGARCRLAYGPADATVSCFSKIQTCFTFLILTDLCSPRKGAVGRVYVCMLCQNLYLLQWTFVVTVCWCSSRLQYQSNSRVISHSFVRLIVERTTSRKHGTPKPVPPPTAAQFPRYFDYVLYINFLPSVLWHCWLGGRKGVRPVRNWVEGCWRGNLSGARCRLALGPADVTATHCLLLQ